MARKPRSLDDIVLDEEEVTGTTTEEDIDEEGEEEEVEGVVEGSAEHDPIATIKPKKPPAEAVDLLDATIEKQVTHLGRATAQKLRKEEKELVMIPIDKLNPKDTEVLVGINGWNFQIMRGQPVLLPVPVVDLLINAGYNPTRVRR